MQKLKSSMTKKNSYSAAILGLLLALATPAWAAEPSGLCSKDPECKKHSEEGLKLYGERKYTQALTEFQQAYDLKPEPRLQLNIGRTLYHLGRPRAALKAYEQYGKTGNPDAEMQKKLEKYIAEAKIAVEAEQEHMPPPPPPIDPATGLPVGAAPPPPPPVPVYKKWWFWTAVGGAALAVGLGVGLGVGLTRPKPDPFVDLIWR
jgi:hypothetical protein